MEAGTWPRMPHRMTTPTERVRTRLRSPICLLLTQQSGHYADTSRKRQSQCYAERHLGLLPVHPTKSRKVSRAREIRMTKKYTTGAKSEGSRVLSGLQDNMRQLQR